MWAEQERRGLDKGGDSCDQMRCHEIPKNEQTAMPRRAIPYTTDRHRCCENVRIMLDLFKIDPDRVRWDLEQTGDGSCRLTIYHAHGSIAESFRTMESALERIDALEDLLLDALEGACTSSESPR